jgi:hypothetical protein
MAEETAVAEPIRGLEGMQMITPETIAWDDVPPVVKTEPSVEEKEIKTEKKEVKTEPEEEIVDELEYLEKQTGFKSWEDVKTTLSKAKEWEQKAMTPAERKFANEESKRLAEAWEAGKEDEVYNLLHTQRELKRAADLPSADAIRMHIKLTNQNNPNFKAADVEDIFEDRYGIPKEPKQGVNEDHEDFQDRLTEYKTRVEKVNRAIERDAFTAKQELAQRMTELKPPEIPKQQVQQGPPQEVLDARKAFVENYRKELPKELQGVKGFTTNFKDEVTEFPVTYAIKADELAPYKAELEAFADKGLDVNTLFSKRWIKEDGSVNIQRMAEELYLLDNRDKVFQKIATETGSQRMEAQRKINNNIKVDGETKVVQMDKTQKGSQAEAIDKLWNS